VWLIIASAFPPIGRYRCSKQGKSMTRLKLVADRMRQVTPTVNRDCRRGRTARCRELTRRRMIRLLARHWATEWSSLHSRLHATTHTHRPALPSAVTRLSRATTISTSPNRVSSSTYIEPTRTQGYYYQVLAQSQA